MKFAQAGLAVAGSILLFGSSATCQSFSSCNPLLTSGCPADTALGRAISVDFRNGAVNSFSASGNPTYTSDGAVFTVAKSGDSPTLTSLFYIMFGKVSITMKAAPGAGIVSTLVLQSDDLDEIDLEWLGASPFEVQSNYFGKGDVTTYNRGAFHATPNNQAAFITYTIEWTAQQIIWSVGSTVVRVLTPATADANQYPQTPMQVKFGTWSGGDPSNAPGTIGWARGPTDYSKGPFSMVVQSISVSDYSTGTQYRYTGTSGTWQSIVAVGGAVNGNAGGAASTIALVNTPAVTSISPSVPAGIGGATTTLHAAASTVVSITGIPSGWTVGTNGKIVPISTAAPTSDPTSLSLLGPSSSLSFSPSSTPVFEITTGWDDRGFRTTKSVFIGWQTIDSTSPSLSPSLTLEFETTTGWDDRGFRTTKTILIGWQTLPKTTDGQGFLGTPTLINQPTAQSTSSAIIALVSAQSSISTLRTTSILVSTGPSFLTSISTIHTPSSLTSGSFSFPTTESTTRIINSVVTAGAMPPSSKSTVQTTITMLNTVVLLPTSTNKAAVLGDGAMFVLCAVCFAVGLIDLMT